MTFWDAIVATFIGLGSPLAVTIYGMLLLAGAVAATLDVWVSRLDAVEALVRVVACLAVAFLAVSLIVWALSSPTAFDWSVA